MNEVKFNLKTGGLGRPLQGNDHISGFVFKHTTAIQFKAFSIDDAILNGFDDKCTDATSATSTITLTNVGTVGNTVKVTVQEPINLVTICDYTTVSGDSTVTLLAVSIVANINANTYLHGYTASNVAGVVTITAPKKLGTWLNASTKIVVTIVGTVAQTLADFTGGVASLIAPIYYHIAEYFRIQPKGVLYCGGYTTLLADGTDILTLQNYANGEIKQLMYFDPLTTFTLAKVTQLQLVANTLFADKTPIEIIAGFNLVGVSTSTLQGFNLNTLTASNISVCISQDVNGKGGFIFKTQPTKSVLSIGAMLGTISLANVQECIAHIARFNLSDTNELEVVGLGNGDLITALSKTTLNVLNDNRFVFLIKQRAIAGTYFNDSHNACSVSSDFAYIENVRVINKAVRVIDTSLMPSLNSVVDVKSNGTLTDAQIEAYKTDINQELDVLLRDNNISAYSVEIDPNQNVVTSSTLNISVAITPKGIARNIIVNIGYSINI